MTSNQIIQEAQLEQSYSMDKLVLSTLGHTWILDLDGTIVKHNGYIIDGADSFLPGAKSFLLSIPEKDMIVFLTSRSYEYREMTEQFLRQNGIRYDHIIFDAPYGERILVNDNKPSGLRMGYSINKQRNSSTTIVFVEDKDI